MPDVTQHVASMTMKSESEVDRQGRRYACTGTAGGAAPTIYGVNDFMSSVLMSPPAGPAHPIALSCSSCGGWLTAMKLHIALNHSTAVVNNSSLL